VVDGLKAHGLDPFALAEVWHVSPAVAMRRIAALAPAAGFDPVALVICDTSGSPTYRQAAAGLQFPRFGAACSMLPLYEALTHAVFPVARRIEMAGPNPQYFRAFAYAAPVLAPRADRPPLLEAHMLATPETKAGPDDSFVGVGVTCGICPRQPCSGRREPSILRESL
jgi:predicted transcriptional regulator